MWVDDISINQFDSGEKSTQVAMMWQVYETAQYTLIYLGDATPRSDALVQELNTLKAIPPGSVVFPGFGDVLRRPWFRRVWILQELGDPWVYCGKQAIHWDVLRESIPLMENYWAKHLYDDLFVMDGYRVDPRARSFRSRMISDLRPVPEDSYNVVRENLCGPLMTWS
jgi:hypothetical protein